MMPPRPRQIACCDKRGCWSWRVGRLTKLGHLAMESSAVYSFPPLKRFLEVLETLYSPRIVLMSKISRDMLTRAP